MARVIALSDYRKRAEEPQHPPPVPRPQVSDTEIWGHNYSRFDGVVQGIVSIRRILDYHLHYSEEWKYHLLCLLDHALSVDKGADPARLRETAQLLQGVVAGELTEQNRKELGMVLVILDLIAKGGRDTHHALH